MMTEPLTPADCDLRDFAFIPIDVQRLLTSETWVLGTADEKAAAITLWLASWHQVPAASVPNNDRMLAHLSQAGSRWPKVKSHALRGWVDGGDGRLYHPVVAEKALSAWIEKLNSAISGAAGNAKRWQTDVDTSDQEAALCDAIERLKRIAPASPCLKKKLVATRQKVSPPDRPPTPKSSPPDRKREGEREGYISTNVDSGSEQSSDPDEPLDEHPSGDFCPHQKIIALYHERCPVGIRVREWTPARSQDLRARWRSKPERQNLEWWGKFFGYVAKSPFLNGEVQTGGRRPFELSLDWLCKAENFAKVIEGKYHAVEPQGVAA